jgi:hypothetical protein
MNIVSLVELEISNELTTASQFLTLTEGIHSLHFSLEARIIVRQIHATGN